jgi:DNA-binding GntR family transcriptional regulator
MNTHYKSIFTPAKKHTLADDVATRLRDAIFTGQLSPGEQISEEVLAKSLNISRGPIREALSQLEHEGLIVIRENRRRFVARLSREDLEEVYGLRTTLELLAVRKAVRHAGPLEIAEMQAIVDKMKVDSASGMTAKQAAEFDISFHDALCRASKQKRLYQLWSDLHQQIQIVLLSRNAANEDYREHAITSHQSILDAICDKNEERAISLMQTHLQASYTRIIAHYDKPGANGIEKVHL